jgi:hypothetical protein
MIKQCYFKQGQPLFEEEPYVGFGLEPEVNDKLFQNCPELESFFNRQQLTEYASYLWHWRNGMDSEWIGSTSYRQLDKFNHKFKSISEIEELLENNVILAWGEYELKNKLGLPISLKTQAKVCHPGLNEFMDPLFSMFNLEFPREWSFKTSGFFANYWIMKKPLFEDFMKFSWPMVEWALNNIKYTDYYKTQTSYGSVGPEKCIGYFTERLFIVWYLNRGYEPFNPSKPEVLFHNTLEI